MAQSSADAFRRAVRRLRPAALDTVALVGEAGYDEGRRPWQLSVEHRPIAVVAAAGTADVVATVRAAAELGLAVTVMTTGHGSVAPADGSVLLNVSALREVEFDRAAGEVEVATGATWSDVLALTAGTGLAPLCGTVPTLGVVGYTLQGGLAWMSRTGGFAAGSVVSAEIVTASGELVVASKSVNPELLWALRGGGGSFGVVTRLRFRLHPCGDVFGGSAYFPIEHAEGTLRAFRDWSAQQPPWSNASLMLLHVPDLPGVPAKLRGRRVLVLRAFATAGEPAARRAMAGVLAAAGPPLLEDYRQTDFAGMIARQGPPPAPTASLERVDLLDRLDDRVLEIALETAGPGSAEIITCVELRQWGGALGHDSGAQAVAHPTTAFSLLTATRFGKGWRDDEVRGAVGRVAAAVAPHANGESLLNFVHDPDRTAVAFSAPTFARLRSIKRDWDPDDLFRPGHQIAPRPPATVGTSS